MRFMESPLFFPVRAPAFTARGQIGHGDALFKEQASARASFSARKWLINKEIGDWPAGWSLSVFCEGQPPPQDLWGPRQRAGCRSV